MFESIIYALYVLGISSIAVSLHFGFIQPYREA